MCSDQPTALCDYTSSACHCGDVLSSVPLELCSEGIFSDHSIIVCEDTSSRMPKRHCLFLVPGFHSGSLSCGHLAGMATLQREVTVVQPVLVKQAMVIEVHTDLGMEVVGMTEGMMTEHTPHVMCTATGVQHQVVKQPTPGLALSGIMDALQHGQQGLMIGRQAACHPGSKQHSRCVTEQRSTF